MRVMTLSIVLMILSAISFMLGDRQLGSSILTIANIWGAVNYLEAKMNNQLKEKLNGSK